MKKDSMALMCATFTKRGLLDGLDGQEISQQYVHGNERRIGYYFLVLN